MLPGNMQISEHKGQRKFEKSYLYDFADLLIVDEAGQVLPEVAAASFALAKRH
jgi:superfamily I DNA and/or RNA helicase